MGRRRPHWRKMTWVLIIFTALMAVLIIAGASSTDCADVGDSAEQAGCESTGIGVALLFFLWFFGFLILSIIWFMTRPKGRDCPVCGDKVKKGQTACAKCGYDFAAALQQQRQPPPPAPPQAPA